LIRSHANLAASPTDIASLCCPVSPVWYAKYLTPGTKINSPDPALTAVRTAYQTPPFLPFLHLPIELASFRPGCSLNLDRRIDFSAVCFSVLTRIKIIPHA
jgi:hypothetical protein